MFCENDLFCDNKSYKESYYRIKTMCLNLKTFNESFREWAAKDEDSRFWWIASLPESVPIEGVAGSSERLHFHHQSANPEINLHFDRDLVGVVGDPNTD